MKICLVVDDSRVVRKVARRILEGLEFEIAEAGDGMEALAFCRAAMPDAVLLDWAMPVMDGLEFIRRLRQEPGGEGPVVVFCTMENDPARIAEALEGGADEYIMKPFDGDIIEAKFAQAGLLLTPDDLAFVAALARAKAGLMLGVERAFFVESRLASLARREGEASVESFVARLRAAPEDPLARAAVEALATPETSFFRDAAPFDYLRDEVLPELSGRRSEGRVRIWCAGCSTGQEPYSIAMLAEEHADKFPNLKLEILATDLSARALEKAQAGLYTQFEVQRGLPIRRLIRHFDKIDDNWQVAARLRQAVRWGRLNLMNDFDKIGRFDVIFCRNVLNYFDPLPRQQVLKRLAASLADDGCLVLGSGESAGLPEAFEPAGAGIHRRNPAYGKAAA